MQRKRAPEDAPAEPKTTRSTRSSAKKKAAAAEEGGASSSKAVEVQEEVAVRLLWRQNPGHADGAAGTSGEKAAQDEHEGTGEEEDHCQGQGRTHVCLFSVLPLALYCILLWSGQHLTPHFAEMLMT